MRLSDLAAYAKEKYHIAEQYKWPEYPGYSVLVDPYSGKWAALLMRRWDPEHGEEIERCDLWCGKEVLDIYQVTYLSNPFRMHGEPWVGVRFDSSTDPDVVRQLFDKALEARRLQGFTIVLENDTVQKTAQYQDTLIPIRKGGPRSGFLFTAGKNSSTSEDAHTFTKASALLQEEPIPKQIQEMRQMYRYGDGSFRQKCKNFYLQGKYMEDYEDEAPLPRDYRQYFLTYHDLNARQLRGYFAWRTKIRKGSYEQIGESFAYMYLYELLNGIGAEPVEERLRKLQEFESKYLDAGFGSDGMRRYLHRWEMELAIIGGMDASVASQYMDQELMARDEALMILHAPEDRNDDELFQALCTIGGNKIRNSTLVQKTEDGKRLFAAVWRYTSEFYQKNHKDLFTLCFGELRELPWHPLANTVFWQQEPVIKADYVLNEIHQFNCRNTNWTELCYSSLLYDKTHFEGLMHETDRRLRIYLNFGHPLKEFSDDAWAAPFIDAVIEEDRKAKAEARRPKIEIHFDDLDRIRRDASKTRDSLLTDEEKGVETEAWVEKVEEAAETGAENTGEETVGWKEEMLPAADENLSVPLSASQTQVLKLLLQGSSVKDLLRSRHIMAEVCADELNEALFELIGDTAVTCDGEELSLIEDYREDMVRILEGDTE